MHRAQIKVMLMCDTPWKPRAFEVTAVPPSLLVPASAVDPSHVPKAFTIHINRMRSLPVPS